MDPCSRNWADLGDGPAGLIADRVLAYDVAGYVRFRAACRSWRRCSADPRAHGGLGRRLHPRRWVMLAEPLAAPNRRRFLNTSTGECVQVDIPELRDHEVLARTPEGFLVLLHARKHVRLLNPLTSQLLQLPPLYHEKLSVDSGEDFHEAWGSGIADDDATVVLCFYDLRMLGVAKPGDKSWTFLEFFDDPLDDPLTTTPLMFAGRFYCITMDGVMVLEMDPPRLVVAASRHMPWISSDEKMDTAHLVDNAGELLLVHRKLLPTRSYDLYRVDLDTKTLYPINSLGAGRALFLGHICSFTVPVDGFPSGSISGDTIYFSFDADDRDKIEAYHLVDTSISPAVIYNQHYLALAPYTLVDCLSLCNIVD